MGGFGVWAQVWSKGSCVGKVGDQDPRPVGPRPQQVDPGLLSASLSC